jgi:hypothetical protein
MLKVMLMAAGKSGRSVVREVTYPLRTSHRGLSGRKGVDSSIRPGATS